MTTDAPPSEAILAALIDHAGLQGRWAPPQPITGGRNNRVWRLVMGDHRFLLKRYFTHPSDPRDRLAREAEFLLHAGALPGRFTPRLLATLPAEHLALLEWIEGSVPPLASIGPTEVDQAIAFIRQINQRLASAPPPLAPASEACFDPHDHAPLIEKRLLRLENLPIHDELDEEARAFVQDELRPLWHDAAQHLHGLPTGLLPIEERCISPSDFGFHNSLRGPDGTLRFVDFEYAGWDDPAKLICDFANQPDMLLDVSLSDRFRQAVTHFYPNPSRLEERLRYLEPVLQIKWACICLNLFLSTGRDRAHFTHGTTGVDFDRRRRQLERAQLMAGRALANL